MDDRKKLNQHKSLAKAVGVKSIVVSGGDIYMTSFGNGNTALLEKKIRNNTSEELNTVPAFDISEITDAKIEIVGKRFRRDNATTDKPNHSVSLDTVIHQDMLCLKDSLEKRFFGKTFDDNIHIQVVYNILDIEKIIAQYVTNAVYALNNLCRNTDDESIDIIGNISTTNTIENFIRKYEGKEFRSAEVNILKNFPKNKRLGYFGNAFYYRSWDKKNNCYKKDKHNNFLTQLISDEEIYQVLELIGSLRQWAFHGVEKTAKDGTITNDKAWIYKLDTLKEKYKDLLDFLYNEAITRINNDFESDNIVNIHILSEIFSEEKYAEIVKEYYEFIVTKKHKNIGFSIKILRENMLNDTPFSSDPDKKNKKYDSVRSKLYKLIDFVLYHGYQNEDKDLGNKMVEQLRSCMNDEDRASIYVNEAKRLWKKYKNIISDTIAEKVEGKNIRNVQNSKKDIIKNVDINNIIIDGYSSFFTELIYLLTAFIDGKEINDLLTTLVQKFDNISSLIDVMNKLNIETTFVDDYKFFENSKKMCNEMVVLNSFARMCPVDVSAKKIMYRDALDILGIESNMNEEELSAYLDKMLCLDENGKMITDKKKKSGMRNFIASNVVDSSRFKYLVRYSNSKKIHAIAKCEPAVYFVLKGIPDSQIERYYVSCRKNEDEPVDDINLKREYLAKIIGEMKFEQFKVDETVQRAMEPKKNDSVEKKENWELKVRYQATIRIYLTVMYLMLKNLVNVNSRYVIGFHCVERDSMLYGLNADIGKNLNLLNEFIMNIESSDKEGNGELKESCPVERYSDAKNRHLRNKKWYGLTYKNMRNSSKTLVKEFRNTVAHVNAIRNIDKNLVNIKYVNSYFEMYHYIIQRELERKYKNSANQTNDTITNYFDVLNKYRSYCKDFVKAYCVPMAYNIVRFKNLTIDGLFDRNDFRGDDSEDESKK